VRTRALRCNSGSQGVHTADANAQHEAADAQKRKNAARVTRIKRNGEGGDQGAQDRQDHSQLQSPAAAKAIADVAKSELAQNRADQTRRACHCDSIRASVAAAILILHDNMC